MPAGRQPGAVQGEGRRAKIEAVDNGNAASVEPFQADRRKAFNGLALLIVRSRAGEAGTHPGDGDVRGPAARHHRGDNVAAAGRRAAR